MSTLFEIVSDDLAREGSTHMCSLTPCSCLPLLVGIPKEIFNVVLDHLKWFYLMGLVVSSKTPPHLLKSVEK
jgi:hypothetical protein